jgi:hypothetical protein
MGADQGEMYLAYLHREARSLLGWTSSNDGLYIGHSVAHRRGMLLDGESGEGTLRKVSRAIRVDSPSVIDCPGKFQVTVLILT